MREWFRKKLFSLRYPDEEPYQYLTEREKEVLSFAQRQVTGIRKLGVKSVWDIRRYF